MDKLPGYPGEPRRLPHALRSGPGLPWVVASVVAIGVSCLRCRAPGPRREPLRWLSPPACSRLIHQVAVVVGVQRNPYLAFSGRQLLNAVLRLKDPPQLLAVNVDVRVARAPAYAPGQPESGANWNPSVVMLTSTPPSASGSAVMATLTGVSDTTVFVSEWSASPPKT